MNKRIIISIDLPMGKKATIEWNEGNFVVCRYHPDNPVYPNDAKLTTGPVNWYKSLVYRLKPD